MLASESMPIHFKESIFKQYASSSQTSGTSSSSPSPSPSLSSASASSSSPSLSPSSNDLALKAKILTHATIPGTAATSVAATDNNVIEGKTSLDPSIYKDNNTTSDLKNSSSSISTTVGVGNSTAIVYPSVDFEQSCKMFNNNNTSHSTSDISNNSGHGQCQEPSMAFIASHPDAEYEKFIRECVDIIIDKAVFSGTNRSSKVVEWHDPAELKQLIDLKVRDNGETNENLLDLIKKTIQYSVKTGHPYFINQLYSGVDPYALIGQWLTDSLNPSVYTFEVAPVFTLMEEEVLHEMRKIVGFPNDGHGDGIFCPGGSIANGYAISCARYKLAPETKQTGLFSAKRMIVFTSEDAHYSVQKLAMYMGFGSDNVWKIPTDKIGKMSLDHLEKQIKKAIDDGCIPLMVSATAGTTVLGAFDPLSGIADLCQKYNMWYHVDAAWGGGALMSKKYRHLLDGIERADSVTWNPHKLLAASQQCSTFLTRHKEILSQCHSTNATYLFQKDKFYDTSYDTGDKHIQCGRRADVFKFWFMWKAKGTKGFEAHVDQVFQMSEFFTEKVRSRPGFELVLETPECTNISFWYLPPSIRDMPRDETFYAKLHAVAPKIKESMIKKGSMMITYQPLGNLPNFFRLVLQNSTLNESDMIYFLNEIETLGCKL